MRAEIDEKLLAEVRSSGDKKNILDMNFQKIGVRVASGDSNKDGKKQSVYTVDYGARQR